MKPILLSNGLVFGDGFRFIATIVVDGGMIKAVDYGRIDLRDVDREVFDVVDCEGKMVMPGVIDEHVHFRDPGLTEKGDMASESRAAIAGGVTSFFDMPNTRPATTSLKAWEEKMRLAAESSAANYAFFLGVTNDNIEEVLAADPTRVPGAKLFLGASTGNMLVDDQSAIAELFRRTRGIIAVHAESEPIISHNREVMLGKYPEGIPVELHHLLRSREACIEATGRVVDLARRTGARLHVLHVTTADELAFFTPGSVGEKRITSETCPHYLYFNDTDIVRTGGLTKCNPAIKTEDDRRALLRALDDGRIDVVATDHAPHLLSQKHGDALTATSGMPSVQFMLPLMLQLARQGYFSYEQVVEKLATNPARIFNIDRRGFIRPQYWADLVVVDPDANYTVVDDQVISKCGWTPYAGQRLNFRVDQTWVNGRLAYSSSPSPLEHTNPNGFTSAQTPLPIRFSPL